MQSELSLTVVSESHNLLLKADFHLATQQLHALGEKLETSLRRNADYFQGVWGRDDKRLEVISGKAPSQRSHHKTKEVEPQKA